MHIVLLRSLLFSAVACFMFTFCVCVTVQWNVNKLVFCFLFLLIYYSITKHQKHLFSRWLLKTIEICKLTILWQIWFMIYLAHVAGYGGGGGIPTRTLRGHLWVFPIIYILYNVIGVLTKVTDVSVPGIIQFHVFFFSWVKTELLGVITASK